MAGPSTTPTATAPWQSRLAFDRVLVTGAGSGIGRAVALRLAALGASVYVLGRTAEKLEGTRELATDGAVTPLVADVTDPASLDAAFDRAWAEGPVQSLVNCAASVEYARGWGMRPDALERVVRSTLLGAGNVLLAWGTRLLDAGLPGVAVALTSAMAVQGGTPGAAHSSAGKAGTESLVKSLAREWGPAGIRLNAVGPGYFPVERTQAMFEPGVAAGQAVVDQTALGRTGELDEIVGPVLFLLTEAAGYVTGETLVADGGYRLTPDLLPEMRFAGQRSGAGEEEEGR